MSHDSVSEKIHLMVTSMEEGWSSLRNLLRESFANKTHQLSSSVEEQKHIYELDIDKRCMSLHCTLLKPDSTDEETVQTFDNCFKSCDQEINAFLLLIQDGCYTTKEKRVMHMLKVNFGEEAFKFLVVLSVEGEAVVGQFDNGLMELINVCDGRFCRITGPSRTSDQMSTLLEMVDYMLVENGASGYTQNMYSEAKRIHTEKAAMRMLREKLQEAEGRERAIMQLIEQREESRGKEVEELRSRHAEERKGDAAERSQYVAKRESCEEAVRSHKALSQLYAKSTSDEGTRQTTIILLGLSGSGKTSARNIILERAGNQYAIDQSYPEAPPSTLLCERREVFAEGRRITLIDTPELWDEDGLENLELVKDCLALSLPGPHAFLLVVQVGRFTQGESEMLWHIQKIFGREAADHAIVLFTRCDDDEQHRVQNIDDYVANAHGSLQDLIRKCGSRYYILNVRNFRNVLSHPQVKELLSGVNKLVASHGGGHYPNKRFLVEELQERKSGIEKGN